jgi:hypothetical protein
MRAVAIALLVASIAGAPACASRSSQPKTADDATVGVREGTASRYREMTWAEYYAEVTERVWKRGGIVVWVSPPSVRRVKRPVADEAK